MAPRSDEQNQALRDERRAAIMQHALELFARHGYEQTSVRMIAQSAGMAQGLLYNYFESKEELLRAIFQQSLRDVRESFAHAEEPADPRPQVERLIRAAFGILRRNLRFWQLGYATRTQAAVLEGLGDDLRTWQDEILTTIERYFRTAHVADPTTEATLLFATIDGVAQHYALDPEHYPLAAVEDALVARYRKVRR